MEEKQFLYEGHDRAYQTPSFPQRTLCVCLIQLQYESNIFMFVTLQIVMKTQTFSGGGYKLL